VLSLRERDYVAASRVLGYGKVTVSIRHLLPNLLPITMVMAVYFMAVAIVAEAGLSFLGLGARRRPPWRDPGPGRDYLNSSWWPVVLAGAALSIMVLVLKSAMACGTTSIPGGRLGDDRYHRGCGRGRRRPAY
jgi:peptide/nickel transport system permease protein